MQFSRHAINRIQQRGIPYEITDLILSLGQPERKHGNAQEYRIRKKDVQQCICNLKYAIHTLEKARNKAVLVNGEEDMVITVYRSY